MPQTFLVLLRRFGFWARQIAASLLAFREWSLSLQALVLRSSIILLCITSFTNFPANPTPRLSARNVKPMWKLMASQQHVNIATSLLLSLVIILVSRLFKLIWMQELFLNHSIFKLNHRHILYYYLRPAVSPSMLHGPIFSGI